MDLYAENILDHYKNPHHKGKLINPTTAAEDSNPLCGDELKIELAIQDNKVTQVAFNGKGCAISQASASMLTDELIGKTPEEIAAISNETIYEMLGVPLTPARVKCALLSLVVVKKALLFNKFSQ